jgi:SRSO17 transposase
MERADLAPWAEAFAAFCARFDDLFVRSESRQQMPKYLCGLVAPLERKTAWQLAELAQAQDTTPERMQRLLYRVPWDAEAARDRLEQVVIERFGDPDGIGVLAETGIPKQGTRSVGVAKQSCAAVGQREHCPVATLLTYASARGHVFLDRRVYLPAAWTGACICPQPGATPRSGACAPLSRRRCACRLNPSRHALCWSMPGRWACRCAG